MTTTQTRGRSRSRWWVPAGLIALSLVPAAAGSVRVAELAGGAAVTEENARFMAAPVPILLHIVGATVFCVAGAFQFVPGSFRRGRHRRAGRVILPCGLVAALAGVWLTLFATLPPTDGPLLGVFRVVFGGGMAAALVLALVAIRRRDIVAHRAWVMRGYAIGMGAGTQAVVFGIYAAAAGTPGVTGRALLLGVGWVLNLVVAERFIRRERRR